MVFRKAVSNKVVSDVASGGTTRRSDKSSGGVFFRELYWFVAICLIGWTVLLFVVPPKASRYWSLVQLEATLVARNLLIRQHIQFLEASSYSVETDPFYREAVLRDVLGVKKNSEEFLQAPDHAVR